ncbi:MAG: metallophosphoesterase family protein [Eggerthellaceae bacterium]|nr:metallophosphoesterase family protein [Eggerthellaceae bacterium]
MTLVGILSDTHGQLAEAAYASLAECDHIIHAGDICGPHVLRELETLAPVTAVLGNNDFDEYGTHVGRFARPVIDGVRFLVAHYPRDVAIGVHGCAGLAPGDPIPHVRVHGHTHVPHLTVGPDARPSNLLMCPGAVFRPRGGFPRCLAKLEVSEGRILGARIEGLAGGVLMELPK